MNKKLMVILTIIMLAFTASAYVPPELRTGEHMTEYEVVKVALTAYDAGARDRWTMDTLEDAVIHHTNSGRNRENYQQLREWLRKIENQKAGIKTVTFIQPEMTRPYDNEGNGWCRGHDKECRNKVN
jgi:hypothetical protein